MSEPVTKEQVEWLASTINYLAVRANRVYAAPQALQVLEAMWSEIEATRTTKTDGESA